MGRENEPRRTKSGEMIRAEVSAQMRLARATTRVLVERRSKPPLDR
jgi:hypothetical protein